MNDEIAESTAVLETVLSKLDAYLVAKMPDSFVAVLDELDTLKLLERRVASLKQDVEYTLVRKLAQQGEYGLLSVKYSRLRRAYQK